LLKEKDKIDIHYYRSNELIMAEYNPRQLSKDQYSQLKDSIVRFGIVDPLIVNTNVDRKNILIGGHQRLRIAKKLGYDTIPCVEVDLTYDKEKELNVRLNKNVGSWDFDSLANFFDVDELLDWGFEAEELGISTEIDQPGPIGDEIPEDVEAVTKPGDLWILGRHRLLCGDATRKEGVEILMDGKKADMVFTDPPFTSDRRISRKKDNEEIGIINKSIKKIHNLEYTDILFEHCDGVILIMGGAINTVKVANKHIDRFKWFYIIYHKQPHLTFNVNTPIIHTFYITHFNSSKNNLRKLPIVQEVGSYKDRDVKEHKYSKKQEVITPYIENISSEGDIVLDVFLGSGSTLIACERTNRKCYGVEIDPHYCDVTVTRWEEFSGKKAERIERPEC
jgi:DNA modification methylase